MERFCWEFWGRGRWDFFSGGGGNSGVRYCPGTGAGGRADDGIDCAGGVEGVYRGVSGVCDAGGDAADVQHCDGIEFGSDFVYGGEIGGGEVERGERAALDFDGVVCG